MIRIIEVVFQITDMEVGVVQLRDSVRSLEDAHEAARKDLAQIEAVTAMGDMAGPAYALSLMAFGIPFFVFIAETPSALTVNLGGPKHV